MSYSMPLTADGTAHKPLEVTVAMAAEFTDRRSMEDIAEMIEARMAKPAKPGPYKKRRAVG